MRVIMLLFGLMLAWPALAEIGEDGLHKSPFLRETFKDLAEDMRTAASEGKRLAIMIEQRGCVYCGKLHEEILAAPEVASVIAESYYIIQLNMFGDLEVTDVDGVVMSEKDIVRRWGILYTPTILFMPATVPDEGHAHEAAAAVMPGVFGKWTTLHMLTWVRDSVYETDETFQRYHARKLKEAGVVE